MNSPDKHLLKNMFYKKLRDNLLRVKKLGRGSVLLAIFEMKSNVRLRLLNESSIPQHLIPLDSFNDMKTQNFIRVSDNDIDQYLITAQGIWQVEKSIGIIGEKILLQYLDKKWFEFEGKDRPLSEKERIILLAMMAARTFSADSVVNLKLDYNALNAWQEILEASYDFLKKHGLISKLQISELYGKRGNEHPVSHLMRHTDALPKKTKGIFTALGKQRYFLDVNSCSGSVKTRLKYLFSVIFYGYPIYVFYEEILRFCRNIASEKTIYLFPELDKHIFTKPSFDDLIEESLRSLMVTTN